jgi:cell division protein FtsQ
MSRARAHIKGQKPSATRAEACVEFARKKAQHRRRSWQRRTLLISSCSLIAISAASVWWLERAGTFDAVATAVSDAFWNRTAAMGFDVGQVYLNGRYYADREAIMRAVQIAPGDPILALDLQAMKASLEAIPEVREARVARVLPHTIRIAIRERVPVALWQSQGVQRLIDEEGSVLTSPKYKTKKALPVIVGDDAPKHTSELLAMLATQPDLTPHVVAAVRVGERRWNVQLSNKVTVLLPEEGAARAWARFGQLVRSEGILTRAVRAIDLRIEDRIFVTPMDEKATPVALTFAKDA